MLNYSEELLSKKYIVFSCLAYSKLTSFFYTLLVWHFSSLFIDKLTPWKLGKNMFSFDITKTNCNKQIFASLFWMFELQISQAALTLPTPNCLRKSSYWQVFYKSPSVLDDYCFRSCLCSQKTAYKTTVFMGTNVSGSQ